MAVEPKRLQFKKPDGKKLIIDADKVLVVSRIFWYDHLPGDTRIYNGGNAPITVMESDQEVADAVGDPPLHRFTMPNGLPVWLNAKAATGPLPVVPLEKEAVPQANAIIVVNAWRQYVQESQDEVARVITAAGGTIWQAPAH